MSEEWLGSFTCVQCGYTSKCSIAMAIHIMINHMKQDADLRFETLGRDCYKCLWDNVLPFELNIRGNVYIRLAKVGQEAYLPLPY